MIRHSQANLSTDVFFLFLYSRLEMHVPRSYFTLVMHEIHLYFKPCAWSENKLSRLPTSE